MRDVIIALDVPTKDHVTTFLEPFKGENLYVKVGMELFYREGLSVIYALKEQGHRVFLDVKLHDIPETVKRTMQQLSSLEVDMVNVHALGGKRMMEAARVGLTNPTSTLLAVTQLTSSSEEMIRGEQQLAISLEKSVLSLSSHAKESGIDGVVCSALEAEGIKKQNGSSFLTVTPGVRLAGSDRHDQVRVVEPKDAIHSDYLVVGRDITRSEHPVASYRTYIEEWGKASCKTSQ
ncbi:orotidine-5'-phosphate decarboxylase [Paenalkalicoccus suaedae]|uniref:Orotidine 5'-phosphate decarboxylase n=1 Tax=Paenalkalicoccus suaedae TaxID=2592382 RepID=A0A859FH13_9BACI|nr:orotidine-5'-phosphate decarboxylase [Paenalkalicoccus suaedae]QKS71496.1 orotidine-5'-phosphate decarboxylase [Paenalkalicoccus suaedae]